MIETLMRVLQPQTRRCEVSTALHHEGFHWDGTILQHALAAEAVLRKAGSMSFAGSALDEVSQHGDRHAAQHPPLVRLRFGIRNKIRDPN